MNEFDFEIDPDDLDFEINPEDLDFSFPMIEPPAAERGDT